MTRTEYENNIAALRKSGRFVFAYLLTDDEKVLSVEQQKSKMKIHFERNLDAFFQEKPQPVFYKNEVERF